MLYMSYPYLTLINPKCVKHMDIYFNTLMSVYINIYMPELSSHF